VDIYFRLLVLLSLGIGAYMTVCAVEIHFRPDRNFTGLCHSMC
jgi:hypothetical protein